MREQWRPPQDAPPTDTPFRAEVEARYSPVQAREALRDQLVKHREVLTATGGDLMLPAPYVLAAVKRLDPSLRDWCLSLMEHGRVRESASLDELGIDVVALCSPPPAPPLDRQEIQTYPSRWGWPNRRE